MIAHWAGSKRMKKKTAAERKRDSRARMTEEQKKFSKQRKLSIREERELKRNSVRKALKVLQEREECRLQISKNIKEKTQKGGPFVRYGDKN